MSARPNWLNLLVALALAACSEETTEAPRESTTEEETREATGRATEETPAEGALDRTRLPIPAPSYEPITELDARNATPPPPFRVDAPQDAPNVLIVLVDDIGFGASETFGGAVRTPTLQRLADRGLRYNQFHTTALCSPTRMALLTGRNHHSANVGSVQEVATAFPGNQGIRPPSVAPLAEMLRYNGYSTAAFGKYHETPPWEVSVSGPFDRWPTHSGFDKFYGFIGGETNQWAPLLFDGVARVEPPDEEGYHLTTDLADQAIAWTRAQHAMTPDKPFFVYFATGATHAPHHVPREFIERYRGQFDEGWDVYREQTLARQIAMGVVPEGTDLTPRPEELPAWDSLTPDERRLHARQMEVFAGFAEHTDREVGRIVDALDQLGELDDTLIFYIFGDNGSSAEGGPSGTFNEMIVLNGLTDSPESQLEHLDQLGGPMAYSHFSAAWAHATNTPFQWTKQVASHYGGTRNPLVVHWPGGIEAGGEVRSQWHHVNDVAPSVMEAANLPFPETVDGVAQEPFEGVSMVYSFDDADAEDRHTTQYFEIFGNRAIYHEGWVAAARHRVPWLPVQHSLEEDSWELYHVAEDFSQAHDLAAENPDQLEELQALFLEQATKYDVLPLDDRSYERFNPAIAGRPDLMGDRRSLTIYPGMDGLMENAFINVKNRSHSITAQIDVTGRGEGVIMCQGGRFAGWALYMKGGKLYYVHNWFGRERYTVASPSVLPPGEHTVKYVFTYDGGDTPGAGGTGALFVDDEQVAEGRIDRTVGLVFSADETAEAGRDEATPVTEEYAEGDNEFNGTIRMVQIDLL